MKTTLAYIAFFFFYGGMLAQDFTLKPCDFNSSFDDYAAAWHDTSVIFVSHRSEKVLSALVDQEGNPSASLFHKVDGEVKKFSKGINTQFNQGAASFSADGKSVYYTANINPKLNARSGEEAQKLGVFFSMWDGNAWSAPIAFKWNDPSWNTAHPCLDPSGKRLYFSSDRPGGKGNSDLYYCDLVNNTWSEPKNMGAQVNTVGGEFYPFVNNNGYLCFSSDGHTENKALDVMMVPFKNGEIQGSAFSPGGINSSANDFAMILSADGKKGYVSTDRVKNQCDIYEIHLDTPEFNGCDEGIEPGFCYLIQETKLQKSDTLPLYYEWDFDDGSSARGLCVEHCFPDFGRYEVKLNVFDSLTGHQFAAVSELLVQIDRPDYPVFEVPDSVTSGEALTLSLNAAYLDGMEVQNVYWFDDRDLFAEGESATWSSSVPGDHYLKIGLSSPSAGGGYEKTCAYRKVHVIENQEVDAGFVERRAEPELIAMETRSAPRFFNDLGQRKPIIYFVELTSSLKQIPLSDPYFENIVYPITERYEFADSSFHYSVGEVSEITELYRIYKQMLNVGYDQALVMDRTSEEFDRSFVKRGMYFPEEVKDEMNTQMNKLSDIQFDTDSHVITKASYDNLEKVVEVMMLEPEIQLMVKAHTDDRGTTKHNQDLSEKRAKSVKDYLISNGISKNRIQCLGFGNTQPIEDNKSEEGRARNRRVEFEILFEVMEKEKNTISTGKKKMG